MAKEENKQHWKPGDVFIVEQRDGVCSVGQVLDIMMKNVVSCAFFDVRVSCTAVAGPFELGSDRLIAALSVSREQLDFAKWIIVDAQNILLDRSAWPNENCRDQEWVGSIVYDAAIAEELLDAYNGLVPWDDWHDPEYLDKLLADPDRKPKHIFYRKR